MQFKIKVNDEDYIIIPRDEAGQIYYDVEVNNSIITYTIDAHHNITSLQSETDIRILQIGQAIESYFL